MHDAIHPLSLRPVMQASRDRKCIGWRCCRFTFQCIDRINERVKFPTQLVLIAHRESDSLMLKYVAREYCYAQLV